MNVFRSIIFKQNNICVTFTIILHSDDIFDVLIYSRISRASTSFNIPWTHFTSYDR